MTPENQTIRLNRNWLLAVLLLAAIFIAYQPVWNAGFGWDDNRWITRRADLHSLPGLRHIWLRENEQYRTGEQYYPITFTSFWLEYYVWGLNPAGYHVVNVFLHACSALLLWLILRRLSVPGAWLAAAIWALHPVCVESVAWITERRNTLSTVFYLCSLFAALKYWLPEEGEGDGRRSATSLPSDTPLQRGPTRYYWLALGLYVLALLSKTSTLPLPAVILLLVWWKRGRIRWQDVRPVLLFPVFGVAMGLITIHVEHLSATEKTFSLPLVDRFLVAGHDAWFYLGKLLWPHPLTFVYPRWKIDPSSVRAWLQVLAVPAVLWALWLKRNGWGRPVLVGLLYYLGLLFLMLGFFNLYYFIYSFVADHFQYLASMGLLTLAAAGIVTGLGRLGTPGRLLEPPLCAALLAVLGILTWNQCRMYANQDILWRTTLARNPDAFLAHNNLGNLLLQNGQVDAAIDELQKAVRIHPDPGDCDNLGDAFLDKGRPDDAIAAFRQTLEIDPKYAMAYDGLGRALQTKGQMDEAITNFQKAVSIQPHVPLPWYNLGAAYAQVGKLDLAIADWQKAVAIQPDFAPANNNLANALLMKGRVAEAEQHWRAALKAEPDMQAAQANLAWVLATCPDAGLRNGAEAVALAQRANQFTGGNDPVTLRTLAAAYAENGQFTEAIATAQAALDSAALRGNRSLAADIQNQMAFYKNGQPFRDSTLIRK